jgi:hypothetical protein
MEVWTMRHRSCKRPPLLIALFCAAVGLTGCGDDKDDNKNPVGPGPGPDEFTQSEAITQAQSAGPQAVALVQSMTAMAGGFGKTDGEYGWNEAEQRWEWHNVYSQAGSTYDWFYTVQYLDAEGRPQQTPTGASRIAHAMTGTGSYHSNDGTTVIDYDYAYDYAVALAGLGTTALTLDGEGGWDIDYSYSYNGQAHDASYELSWDTLEPGITIPLSGCPTGTIRYDLPPYRMDVVFDGTATAAATLYDANGTPVQAGSRTYPLSCTPE